jgi:NADPH2:quinone reductase
VKYRLEATRVTADADAQMVVPHSLDLTCKTTTLHATAQSLAVSVLDLVATRAGEPAGNAIARSVELAQLGGRTSLHSGTGLLSLTGTNRTYRSRDENDSSGQRWIATVPDVMTLSEEPVPEPKDGEVLIRVGFAGVNSSDSKARSGESARAGYRVRDFKFPFVTGMDAAGVVERTGSNANGFGQGDRVITWSAADGKTWGSYAEFMPVPVRNVSPRPKSLSFAQAAAVPVAALTAFQALFHAEKGGMIPGRKVLIHGAAGGVGNFAVQFAKSGGLLVAATCGANNVAYVRSLGAVRVIDYETEDIGRAIRDWSAEGVDVVLAVVGSTTLPHALDMLRPGGRLVSILTVTQTVTSNAIGRKPRREASARSPSLSTLSGLRSQCRRLPI